LNITNKEIISKNAGANIKIIASDFDRHLCTFMYVLVRQNVGVCVLICGLGFPWVFAANSFWLMSEAKCWEKVIISA